MIGYKLVQTAPGIQHRLCGIIATEPNSEGHFGIMILQFPLEEREVVLVGL